MPGMSVGVSVLHSPASLCPAKTPSASFLPQTLVGSQATPRVISLFPCRELLAPEQLVSSWSLGGAEQSRQGVNPDQGRGRLEGEKHRGGAGVSWRVRSSQRPKEAPGDGRG